MVKIHWTRSIIGKEVFCFVLFFREKLGRAEKHWKKKRNNLISMWIKIKGKPIWEQNRSRMGSVTWWGISTGPEKEPYKLVPLNGINVGRQKAFLSDPHKPNFLGSHSSQSGVPSTWKRGYSQTSPYGVVQTFDLFDKFHKQERKLEKEKPIERDIPRKKQNTSIQRLQSPTLKVVTSFVMLSKMENMFLKTISVQCRHWVMCPKSTINLEKQYSPTGRKFLIRKPKHTVN